MPMNEKVRDVEKKNESFPIHQFRRIFNTGDCEVGTMFY